MSRSSALLAPAHALLAGRLSRRSLEHSERTAACARVLAARFGVDADGAELAGLLHDYARDVARGDMVAEAEELGVSVLPVEQEHPYLLHARLGAALVRRDLPGVGEAVLSAVAVHTVGGLPMSDLDKVTYLADMIEPARDFAGVDQLRVACEVDSLEECFRIGYGMSLRHVRETGRPVHPVSGAVSAAIERETGKALFDPPAVRS
jgi:predicted HD superfamily hydrolase involved in NAD metabolism